jgi:8-oxo-dGTP diphosphatase
MVGMANPPELRNHLRVSAYALCVRDGQVLLARYIGHLPPSWTLPGGGVEHGEDPADAVLRELTEETGYSGRVVRLLGINSARHQYDRDYGVEDQHALRVMYEVDIVGGALRNEVGGTTDLACWHQLDAVSGLERAGLVDIGLSMRGGQ